MKYSYSKRPYFNLNLIDAFEYHVNPEPNTGCWLWDGATFERRGGYGCFTMRSENLIMKRAHRVAWTLYCGEIPNGLHVLHICDMPICVNPDHLFLGNQPINMMDKSFKGRQSHSENHPKYIHGKYVGQKQNPNYKHPLN